ncbi:hypothetical protein BDN71DRAFT_1443284 [Pleurotus eryngii]|uniref:Uncharacterized protein n=1 Tax=Pleurotus eryngii TaxID=5323 RepID=A0A9P6A1X8_PLEER|nr:hypothetical protein BDN71DRAFT_1443284 [Pleurotus eryngii]
MCYANGSIDQAVNVCPMCKVFPNTRCPHVREVCSNRTNHPRADVVCLKNAEVDSFNGCGFCKWARTNPPAKLAGYNNPGWPGCCRPPGPNEFKMIQAADWMAVSKVHHIPIPSEVKAAFDGFASRGSPTPPSKTPTIGRGASGRSGMPLLDRRNSGNTSPSNKTPSKSSSMAIPSKGRSGGSPQQAVSALLRTSSGNPISTSVPSSSNIDRLDFQRRLNLNDAGERRIETSQSAHSSPNRKHLDLDGTPNIHRRSASSRPHVNAASHSPSPSHGTAPGPLPQPSDASLRRRASVSNSNPISSAVPGSRRDRSPPAPAPRNSAAKRENIISSASSNSGSEGSGSMSDNTVTSDGGFTDYLSDESEAELQRQAEARAAVLAQNAAEELEFKAARQQLAHVDLRPPKSWNATKEANSGSIRLHPTSHYAAPPYAGIFSVPNTASPRG